MAINSKTYGMFGLILYRISSLSFANRKRKSKEKGRKSETLDKNIDMIRYGGALLLFFAVSIFSLRNYTPR